MPVATGVYFFAQTGAADFSVSDHAYVAYLGYASLVPVLVWMDRAGHQLGTLGPANANVKSGRLSPDGQRLAAAIYDLEKGEQDLWIFDLKTNSGRRLTAEPGLRDSPVWSPDLADSLGLPARGRRHPAPAPSARPRPSRSGRGDAGRRFPGAD